MSDAGFGVTPLLWSSEAYSEAIPDVTSPTVARPHQYYFGTWRRADRPTRLDIEQREAVTVVDYSEADVAVMPGQAATADVFKVIRARERLRRLIGRFAREGFSRGGEELKITKTTAEASVRLVDLLPQAAVLPKIVPSGEGALTFVWQQATDAVIVVASDWRLNIVTKAGTPQAEYHDDIAFDGRHLPHALIEAVTFL